MTPESTGAVLPFGLGGHRLVTGKTAPRTPQTLLFEVGEDGIPVAVQPQGLSRFDFTA
jgi:hypothetical protein